MKTSKFFDLLLVDDHEIIRDGLKNLLKRQTNINKVDTAASGGEALEKLAGQKYDAAILDFMLPDMNGLDILARMKDMGCNTPVLIFSGQSAKTFAPRLLASGASGFLEKGAPVDEFHSAINRVLTGGTYVPQHLIDHLLVNMNTGENGITVRHEILSNRELEVLLLISSGLSCRQIAERKKLGIKSIETYRKRMMDKMNFETTAEAIVYTIREELIE